MVESKVIQKIQLVEGNFTASEASDIVSALIKEKINFHKLQRLGQLIHDETIDGQESRERIEVLMNERKIAKEFISKARVNGRKIKIHGTLEITYED
jgi:hypothetical protein